MSRDAWRLPLSHGFSPRPEWVGTCPSCGALAGTDCALLTSPNPDPLHVPEPEPPRRSGCSIFGWLALILVWVLW